MTGFVESKLACTGRSATPPAPGSPSERPGPRRSDLLDDPAGLRAAALANFEAAKSAWIREGRRGFPFGVKPEPTWPTDPLLDGLEFAVRSGVIPTQNRHAVARELEGLESLLVAAGRGLRGPGPDLGVARRFWLTREVVARARRREDDTPLPLARKRATAPEMARAHVLMFDEHVSEATVRQRRRRFGAILGEDPWLPRRRG